VHFAYSPSYIADIGLHVFPIEKYRLVAESLRQRHHIPESAFIEPEPAAREQLLRVHTERYLDDLDHCRWTPRTMQSELPLSPQIVGMFRLACGGTIRAAEFAMDEGVGVHIGGGFHHAFAEKAEGFCYLNDLAVAIRELQSRGRIQRAMVIDCDLHQGNGTARIFQGDPSVFTFSMHQGELYPVKEESDLDIHLEKGIADDRYLELMCSHIPKQLDEFRPELILYQAGADPFEEDQLGDLKLTIRGLEQRDKLILRWAEERRIPLAVTLGGGYARNTADTVKIHVNTGLAAWATNPISPSPFPDRRAGA
jgi:acetoin utilization deacetylase AcuC-like enzyme